MLRIKQFHILQYLFVLGLFAMLTACGGGGGGDDGPVFNPDEPPKNVQVVAGDGDNSIPGNVISWTEDIAATGHKVYWSYDENVTVNDPEVVPTVSRSTYIVHADPTEVFPGKTIYYLVVATAGGQVSVPSAVVYGTPQLSVTGNSLNDVAWNGLPVNGSSLAMVAVGDSGTILTSPNGTLDGWEVVDHGQTDESLAGVTWGNTQFVAVGAGATVLTSSDGIDWVLQDSWVSPDLESTDLEDVTWTGSEYVVVGKNGAVLTGSADGTTWTVQSTRVDSAITLEGVAEGAGTLVAVGTKGTIITRPDGEVNWTLIDLAAQGIDETNDLNDVTWDGTRFGVVGSNSTLLSSSDGLNWSEHNPDMADYTLEGAVQWDPFLPDSLPLNPVLAMVGSAGTFYVTDDPTRSGARIPTATNEQLEAIIWVDREGDQTDPYFLMVGHDGTVLTNQYSPQ